MANYKKGPAKQKLPAAKTPEAREAQIISYAWDLAEERILDGTASNALLVQCLRMGGTRERKEKELMDARIENTKIKTKAIESERKMDEIYAKALNAMRIYSGQQSDEDESDIDFD